MLTRRRFAALSVAAAGTALVSQLKLEAATTRSGLEFGVQLYTVRDRLKDLSGMGAYEHRYCQRWHDQACMKSVKSILTTFAATLCGARMPLASSA